jgi:uncharacterized membrane protein YqjE
MSELQQFIAAALGQVLLIGVAAMFATLLLLSLVALTVNAISE